MAQLPSYDQWMKDTYSLTSPRSEYLLKLDEAIKTQNRDTIKTAFDRWRFEQSKQGKKWMESVRNKKGAVTNLHRALTDVDRRQLTDQEIESMRWASQQQALALQKMFLSRDVKFKSNTLIGMANGAGSKWEKFKNAAASGKGGGSSAKELYGGISDTVKGANLLQQGGKAAAQGAAKSAVSDNFATIRKSVTDFCHQLCPGLDPNTVFNALKLGSIEHFASNLAPFVGAISSGGKAIVGWIGVAKKAYDRGGIIDSRYAFAQGDPEAAFDSVLTMINRELASETARATASTVAFTGKTLAAFADAGAVSGPVIGMLETLAEIFQTVVEYVRDYKECQLASQLLKVGALNLELFAICPILGCYFVVVQDHSTIINFAVADYGTPNWTFDVNKLVSKINPVLSKARQFIHASRLEIPGMSNYKGVVEANYSHKKGLDKLTGASDAIKDKIASKMDAWFDKPQAAAKWDKSRIVGMGSDSVRVRA